MRYRENQLLTVIDHCVTNRELSCDWFTEGEGGDRRSLE